MTNAEINESIARACGWKKLYESRHSQTGCPVQWWRKGDDQDSDTNILPDYCNDHNAIVTAEAILFGEQVAVFFDELHCALNRDAIEPDIINSTALHRATAFLRTLNLWRDE